MPGKSGMAVVQSADYRRSNTGTEEPRANVDGHLPRGRPSVYRPGRPFQQRWPRPFGAELKRRPAPVLLSGAVGYGAGRF